MRRALNKAGNSLRFTYEWSRKSNRMPNTHAFEKWNPNAACDDDDDDETDADDSPQHSAHTKHTHVQTKKRTETHRTRPSRRRDGNTLNLNTRSTACVCNSFPREGPEKLESYIATNREKVSDLNAKLFELATMCLGRSRHERNTDQHVKKITKLFYS